MNTGYTNWVTTTLLTVILFCFASLVFGAGGSGAGNTPYFEIPSPFVVNLAEQDSLTFLQVNAQFKVTRPEIKSQLSRHLPAIQHTVMMVLSDQSTSQIKSVAGKEKLRAKTLQEIQSLLQEQIGEPGVEEIYFTGFIIQ